MIFMDDYDLGNVKNEGEKIVLSELSRQLDAVSENPGDIPLCLCNECVADMTTLALNKVPPLYTHTLKGKIYTDAALDDDAYAATVRESVAWAIEKVRKNPSHD
jgi:hypothetical protein